MNLNTEAQRGEDIATTLDTTHARNKTGQNSTKAGDREREGRISEVESESRADGTSACDDCILAVGFQFFSHLIFGPIVQGFSIYLQNGGLRD